MPQEHLVHYRRVVGSNRAPATNRIICSQGLTRTRQILSLWVHYPKVVDSNSARATLQLERTSEPEALSENER
jgi:hypothetical protein